MNNELIAAAIQGITTHHGDDAAAAEVAIASFLETVATHG